MTDFGYNTIGASNDNPAANWVWCKATSTPGSNGTLTAITAYCARHGSGASTVTFALYADSSGVPGARLATADALTSSAVASGFGWVSQDLSSLSQAIVSGTQYWLGIRCPNYDNGLDRDVDVKFDTNSGATELYYDQPPGSTPAAFPSTAGSGGTLGLQAVTDERWSIYATYTPSGGSVKQRRFGLMQQAVRRASDW